MELTSSEWVQIGVAGTTGLLALATFYMASKTRRMAESTELAAAQTRRMAENTEVEARAVAEQAHLTRASLQASIQPWLTRVTPPIHPPGVVPSFYPAESFTFQVGEEPHRVHVDRSREREVKVTLFLRNVGRGVALIKAGDGCLIEGRAQGDEPVTRYGFPSAAALPPGEITRLSFLVQRVDVASFLSTHRNWGEFWVKVLYTDVNTDQPVWAKAHLTASDASASEWLFHEIEYTRQGEDAPFASVRFDAGVVSSTTES